MKKKLTITIASILSVIVIIGVGFAAWVITNPKVEDTADGSISVETVTDKSYTLTAAISNGAISFGAPKNMDTANAWLKAEGGNSENLEATLTLTLNYNNFDDVGVITFKMETLKGSVVDGTFASLVTVGYIVNPTISYKATDAETYTAITEAEKTVFTGLTVPKEAFKKTTAPSGSAMGVATATIKITFGWGLKFGNTNPYTYFNGEGHSYDKDYKTAKDALTELTKLDKVNYKVTVTGTTAAA